MIKIGYMITCNKVFIQKGLKYRRSDDTYYHAKNIICYLAYHRDYLNGIVNLLNMTSGTAKYQLIKVAVKDEVGRGKKPIIQGYYLPYKNVGYVIVNKIKILEVI
jgi:hypothetical protein